MIRMPEKLPISYHLDFPFLYVFGLNASPIFINQIFLTEQKEKNANKKGYKIFNELHTVSESFDFCVCICYAESEPDVCYQKFFIVGGQHS